MRIWVSVCPEVPLVGSWRRSGEESGVWSGQEPWLDVDLERQMRRQ